MGDGNAAPRVRAAADSRKGCSSAALRRLVRRGVTLAVHRERMKAPLSAVSAAGRPSPGEGNGPAAAVGDRTEPGMPRGPGVRPQTNDR